MCSFLIADYSETEIMELLYQVKQVEDEASARRLILAITDTINTKIKNSLSFTNCTDN